MHFLLVLVGLFFSLSSCQSPPAPRGGDPLPFAVSEPDPETAGIIQGEVLFAGTPPPPTKLNFKGFEGCKQTGRTVDEDILVRDGKVQNAFLYIKEGLSGMFVTPQESVVLDQTGCLYSPRVVGVQAGQMLEIRNSDPLMHNVHAMPKKLGAGFNIAMANNGPALRKNFFEPEVMVPIRCDVHPWMKAFVGVIPYPYFSVTDAAGRFLLKNVPPGNYTVEVWHERFGRQTAKVTVDPKETESITFTFAPAKQ